MGKTKQDAAGGSYALAGGIIQPLEKARIPVTDHGFLFGDSAYEVIRAAQGEPVFLRHHFERLHRTLKGLGLELPWSDGDLEGEIRRVLKKRPGLDSYVRIIITRGAGAIDIDPDKADEPNLVIIVKPWPIWPEQNYRKGVNVALVDIRRNDRRTLDPALKTGNYLNNVLAFREARGRGCDDAVFLNPSGCLTESTTSNVFFVKRGVLKTPALKCGILSGISRKLLIQAARRDGLKVETGFYKKGDLIRADEAFISSTTRGVMPVTRVDGRPIGDGGVGPLTKQCAEIRERLIQREIERAKK